MMHDETVGVLPPEAREQLQSGLCDYRVTNRKCSSVYGSGVAQQAIRKALALYGRRHGMQCGRNARCLGPGYPRSASVAHALTHPHIPPPGNTREIARSPSACSAARPCLIVALDLPDLCDDRHHCQPSTLLNDCIHCC